MGTYTYMHNGEIKDTDRLISVRDTAPLRGYGLFDYFKVIEGVPVFVEDHIARLLKSCEGLDLSIPYDANQLKAMILKMIDHHPVDTFAIRFLVTPGVGIDSGTKGDSPEVFCIGEPIILPSSDDIAKGWKLISFEYTRYLFEFKSINYLQLMTNKKLLKDQNANDFIFKHNGFISESTRANVFFVKDSQTLVTSSENILEGVTRKKLIENLPPHYEIEIRPIHYAELKDFKEAFITGSSKNVMPVFTIDEIHYDRENTVTRDVKSRFDLITSSYIKAFRR
jgi:D-alanine transaminase/branched-chain amino acid aminotransferase